MWCKRCGPVLGVKNTHRVRNTGALLSSVALPGAFLFGKVEGHYCPSCGGKVQHAEWPLTTRLRERTELARAARGANGSQGGVDDDPTSIEPRDEAYWEAYVARVTGKPAPRHVTRVTSDGKWISFDDGEHFASTADLPPPPAPPEQPDEPGPSSLPADSGVADALLRLSELHRSGELTDDEFAAAKGKLLSN
jgi:hypothetical protein